MATSHAWGKVIENRVHSVHLIIPDSFMAFIKEHKFRFINISFNHLKDILQNVHLYKSEKMMSVTKLHESQMTFHKRSNTMSTSTSHWNLWCASFNDIISISMLVTKPYMNSKYFFQIALIALKLSLFDLNRKFIMNKLHEKVSKQILNNECHVCGLCVCSNH